MGYLLKEALKTLCGVNQWSYAVFWKIGCQNPKLLIWEDCYYETASYSGLSGNENPETAFQDYNASWVSAETRNLQSNVVQAGDKVHLLVNKMMMDNHVNIVGEGLVGRVAFTGNHQWILSENYYREAHPPEVQKEVCQQFSAGMQIMENTGFVNDVTSLLLQLGYISGVFPSANYAAKECTPNVVNPPCSFDSFNYVGKYSGETPMVDSQTSFSFAREIQNEPQIYHQEAKIAPPMKLDFSSSSQLMNGVAKAEVIPSNSEMWMNQNASLYAPRSNLNRGAVRCADQKILSDNAKQGLNSTPSVSTAVVMPAQRTNSGLNYFSDYGSTSVHVNGQCKGEPSNMIPVSGINTIQAHDILPSQYSEHLKMTEINPGFVEDDEKQKFGPESGDDLFDVLGADFKNKLFSHCWNSSLSNESAPNVHTWDKNNSLSKKSLPLSEIYSTSHENSESGIFSSTSTDHLLEAVVLTKVHPSAKQGLDDNVSCRTTLTNMSSSSAPNSSLPYGRFGLSDQMKGELFGVPKYLAKAGGVSSCSLTSGPSKEESGTYSQGSSIYGSQISSWIGKDQKAKQTNSVSTGYSKKPDETSKTNRKRLKPGENPRPRPKDRQMIQDRVKELREIVPNGAKCSIDALLERTIKHMLFLQSVTKHADKLKQTGESKIISKDGGLLLKDNFDGGATWAYEVGSQSMVCPIIVEDLNQPRQMLVEMLCEERGLFLEIADIIRGLGLTILKGVMETRNDKIWARFAVEANRDVTRMEIFISLVRLLEQTAKSGNGENLTAQQYHQVAPAPVTVRSRQ